MAFYYKEGGSSAVICR